MSRINRVRIINLKYNRDACEIGDETFDMNGENTLLSLRNGGGKTVLVQMIMAPFVHRHYRDLADRKFSYFFNTSKPTFIMVEWKLDGGGGYVLTGMMVRQSQDADSAYDTEITNFITEYDRESRLDIAHIPFTEETSRGVVLKGYVQCRQLFDSWKKEAGTAFFCYDMNQSAQSRQYFDKLSEYQIYYREWEAIIHKINMEESGLSNLFSDCKNEEGLVEKWLLDTIEKKLNRGSDSIKEFRSLTAKYVRSYMENRSKIKRRDSIEVFRQQTAGVREEGERYLQGEQEMRERQDQIALFRDSLEELLEKKHDEEEGLTEERDDISSQINHLKYQKYSFQIYENDDRIEENEDKIAELCTSCKRLTEKRNDIEKSRHLLSCAREQRDINATVKDLRGAWQKLSAQKEKDKNNEPERERIGCQLAGYYSDLKSDTEERIDSVLGKSAGFMKEISKNRDKLKEEQAKRQQASKEIGGLDQLIELFAQREQIFNKKYNRNLSRNILGLYEEGTLTEERLSGEERLTACERSKKELLGQKLSLEQREESLAHKTEEERKALTLAESDLSYSLDKKKEFDGQIEERREIIRYFDIKDMDILDTEGILSAARKKLSANEDIRKSMEISLAVKTRELRQLGGEEAVELSDEFKTMLEEAGIDYVYGMRWLSKNANSEDQNRMLVEKFPFLPYSLIISRSDMKRLSLISEKRDTSIPVPFIVREDMNISPEEEGTGSEENLFSFGNVCFYVCFNNELLNKERMEELLAAKEHEISHIKDSIASREKEYRVYYDKYGRIANQEISREVCERLDQRIEGLRADIEKRGQLIDDYKKEQASVRDEIASLAKRAGQADEKIRSLRTFLDDLSDFTDQYQSYIRVFEKRKRVERSLKETEDEIRNINELSTKLEEDLRRADEEKSQLRFKLTEINSELSKYQQYERSKEAVTEEMAVELIARFEALTSKSAVEVKELEKTIAEKSGRLNEQMALLNRSAVEYGFSNEEWKEVVYDQEEMIRLENESETLLSELNEKQGQVASAEKNKGKLEERRDYLYRKMREETGEEEAVPKAQVPVISFDQVILEKKHLIKEKEDQIKETQKRAQVYEENLAAMAEFSDLKRNEDQELINELSEESPDQIVNRQGELKRGYHRIKERLQRFREEIGRQITAVMRTEELSDDFFQKPLATLMSLTNSAERLLEQLDIITSSFDQLIEKLLVDISLVEKEENELVDMLSDYLAAVNSDLGKIDDNSTITVRNRPVKMLQIKTPDWEANEAVYITRLKDYVRDVTEHCVLLLSENKNIEEYLGVKLTTKALYDAVAGISNVTIHLYKIEASREYPITWSEVARNSGGEGFLSAFVILTSLLYYLRRNDSDIFADRKESKVIIMDNPFAQTNASHLLVPLMDFASKTNTQLICLSGLGGESIYNRFDNIYVLNLYPSSLRNGLAYLKAEHQRGNAAESMMVSNVRVKDQGEFEQMSLF